MKRTKIIFTLNLIIAALGFGASGHAQVVGPAMAGAGNWAPAAAGTTAGAAQAGTGVGGTNIGTGLGGTNPGLGNPGGLNMPSVSVGGPAGPLSESTASNLQGTGTASGLPGIANPGVPAGTTATLGGNYTTGAAGTPGFGTNASGTTAGFGTNAAGTAGFSTGAAGTGAGFGTSGALAAPNNGLPPGIVPPGSTTPPAAGVVTGVGNTTPGSAGMGAPAGTLPGSTLYPGG